MTSYLRSWLYSGTTDAEDNQPDVPSIERISPPPPPPNDEEDDGEETETERDNDSPPAFPSFNSAQRASTSTTPVLLTDTQLMPPPPLPSLATRQPGVPPVSKPNTLLAVPPRTEKPPTKLSNNRQKVALAPGFGPLDWAALKASGADLRGVNTLMRVPPSVLKKHNKSDDAWTSINGKIYNITPYLKYHPGGEKELMRVAGRDGTKLFGTPNLIYDQEFLLKNFSKP